MDIQIQDQCMTIKQFPLLRIIITFISALVFIVGPSLLGFEDIPTAMQVILVIVGMGHIIWALIIKKIEVNIDLKENVVHQQMCSWALPLFSEERKISISDIEKVVFQVNCSESSNSDGRSTHTSAFVGFYLNSGKSFLLFPHTSTPYPATAKKLVNEIASFINKPCEEPVVISSEP